jgi:hypothetical protein
VTWSSAGCDKASDRSFAGRILREVAAILQL